VSVPQVTVRYWAAAKSAAGREADEVRAATLADALAAVRDLHVGQARFAAVLAMCSLVVDEQPVASRNPDTVTLREGAVVEVLPPFAGGARPRGADHV
jgi:molybdopterin synthase sulfur carrier subunit